MNSQTQRITWRGEAGAIEGLLDQPEGSARGVAVVDEDIFITGVSKIKMPGSP